MAAQAEQHEARTPCPACLYPLERGTDATCPECGRHLAALERAAFWAEQRRLLDSARRDCTRGAIWFMITAMAFIAFIAAARNASGVELAVITTFLLLSIGFAWAASALRSWLGDWDARPRRVSRRLSLLSNLAVGFGIVMGGLSLLMFVVHVMNSVQMP